MKKIILSLIMVSVVLYSLGQDTRLLKYRARYVQITKLGFEKLNQQPVSCSLLISINFDSERINIFATVQKSFDIISHDEPKDKDGAISYSYYCMDENGRRCNVFFIHFYSGLVATPWTCAVQYEDEEYIYDMDSIEN